MQTPCDEILIVDDEASYAEMLSSVLREEGFNAQMLTKPGEAIEYIRRHRCALVVADYKMPDLNGAEFLQQVRESHPNLPVIMISGHMNTRDLLSVANMSVTLVLEKPFAKDVLIENVRRFVSPKAVTHAGALPSGVNASANPYPSANLHCAHASEEAKAFLQSLWHAICQHNGAILSLPLGGELDMVVADLENWFELQRPAIRLSPSMMQVDLDGIANERVLVVVDARYASSDLGDQIKELRQFLPEGFPILVVQRSDNAKAATDMPLVVLSPLAVRKIDVASYSRAILERVGTPGMLSPEAARLLLNYPWPGNYYELMGALRRALLACESGVIDAPMLAAAIADRHGAATAGAAGMTLEKYLGKAQSGWFENTSGMDDEEAARAANVNPALLIQHLPLFQQPLLFPELLGT